MNNGKWYKTTYDSLIKDPENDYLCPLILASDKTTLLDMGDLHVECKIYDYIHFQYPGKNWTISSVIEIWSMEI